MEIPEAVESFVAKNQDVIDKYYADTLPSLTPVKLLLSTGKKYIKVIEQGVTESHRSVHAFIDPVSGQIFKPAGWSRPAKWARGNVNSDENGMEAIGFMGSVAYLRG